MLCNIKLSYLIAQVYLHTNLMWPAVVLGSAVPVEIGVVVEMEIAWMTPSRSSVLTTRMCQTPDLQAPDDLTNGFTPYDEEPKSRSTS